jgi:hypothetical protein
MNRTKATVRIRFEAQTPRDLIPGLRNDELIIPYESDASHLKKLLSFMGSSSDKEYFFRIDGRLLTDGCTLQSLLGDSGTFNMREELCTVKYEQVREELGAQEDIPVDDWIRTISVNKSGIVMYACCNRMVYFYDAPKRLSLGSCQIQSDPSCSACITMGGPERSFQETLWFVGCNDGSTLVFCDYRLRFRLVGEGPKTSLSALETGAQDNPVAEDGLLPSSRTTIRLRKPDNDIIEPS